MYQKKRINGVVHWFLDSSRATKRALSICFDIVMLLACSWSALALRLGEFQGLWAQSGWAFLLAPVCCIPFMVPMGLYRAVIRYVGYRALWTVFRAVTLGVLVWALVLTLTDVFMPRSSILIFWMAALVSVGGSRILGRWLFRQFTPMGRSYKNRHASRALVYGAGASGQQMATAFLHCPEVSPVGFVDDNQSLRGTELMGLRVFSPADLADVIDRYDVDTVLLAIRSLPASRKRDIVHLLEEHAIKVKVMPTLGDMAHGRINFQEIPDIDVVDLLQRDSVQPNPNLLNRCVENLNVMVTGSGGSIGSELCRQIIRLRPRRLVLFELSEFALYSIEQELQAIAFELAYEVELIAVLGNVQNQQHLALVLKRYDIHTLYHAAAYKHVPIVEHNLISGIHNNVLGTLSAAEAAIASGVQNFVLISTDKAVRPTNVMGASKRLAEMVLQAVSKREASRCAIRFSMVRFGNVLGSSGSVIPLFRKQIAQGGPVTVTHPEITRYFMTIPEAASLVIQAGSMGDSGDVFVLDMGKPVKVDNLAREMIRLAGFRVRDEFNPDGDLEILYTGLRPGEKLYEELLIGGAVQGTEHSMIMRATEDYLPWGQLAPALDELRQLTERYDYVGLVSIIQRLVSGYQSTAEICDHLYQPPPPLTLTRVKP